MKDMTLEDFFPAKSKKDIPKLIQRTWPIESFLTHSYNISEGCPCYSLCVEQGTNLKTKEEYEVSLNNILSSAKGMPYTEVVTDMKRQAIGLDDVQDIDQFLKYIFLATGSYEAKDAAKYVSNLDLFNLFLSVNEIGLPQLAESIIYYYKLTINATKLLVVNCTTYCDILSMYFIAFMKKDVLIINTVDAIKHLEYVNITNNRYFYTDVNINLTKKENRNLEIASSVAYRAERQVTMEFRTDHMTGTSSKSNKVVMSRLTVDEILASLGTTFLQRRLYLDIQDSDTEQKLPVIFSEIQGDFASSGKTLKKYYNEMLRKASIIYMNCIDIYLNKQDKNAVMNQMKEDLNINTILSKKPVSLKTILFIKEQINVLQSQFDSSTYSKDYLESIKTDILYILYKMPNELFDYVEKLSLSTKPEAIIYYKDKRIPGEATEEGYYTALYLHVLAFLGYDIIYLSPNKVDNMCQYIGTIAYKMEYQEVSSDFKYKYRRPLFNWRA